MINHTTANYPGLSEADATALLAQLGTKSRSLATEDGWELLKKLEIAVTPDGEPSVRYQVYSTPFSWGDNLVSGEAGCSSRATELGVYTEAHIDIGLGAYSSWYVSALTKFNEQGLQSLTESGFSFKIGQAIVDALAGHP